MSEAIMSGDNVYSYSGCKNICCQYEGHILIHNLSVNSSSLIALDNIFHQLSLCVLNTFRGNKHWYNC